MMKMRKRQRQRQRQGERDRLSELPDCVLLHIMDFMDTKDAVRTCVLSKRWKDLWKRLTNLVFNIEYFDKVSNFSKYVSHVLSGRDGSISLSDLEFTGRGCAKPTLFNRVMKYAVLHNVQRLTIFMDLLFRTSFEFRPFIFSCRSLTFLNLFINAEDPSIVMLPKSLQLPAIKTLKLGCVSFTAADNDCANPFSTCNVLNTLELYGCSLLDAKILCISNVNLSNLTIDGTCEAGAYKISLSTPNLSFLTIGVPNHIFSNSCTPPSLEEVIINIGCSDQCIFQEPGLLIISWLQVLANVKILTLSRSTLELILKDLSIPDSMSVQPPCFVRLKSLNVMKSFGRISHEEIKRMVEYLLKNSPLARVDTQIGEMTFFG